MHWGKFESRRRIRHISAATGRLAGQRSRYRTGCPVFGGLRTRTGPHNATPECHACRFYSVPVVFLTVASNPAEPEHVEKPGTLACKPIGWRLSQLPCDHRPIERCQLIKSDRGQNLEACPGKRVQWGDIRAAARNGGNKANNQIFAPNVVPGHDKRRSTFFAR